MKISICASIHFAKKINEVADELRKIGWEVTIPRGAQDKNIQKRTLRGDSEEQSKVKLEHNLIKKYFEEIKKSDAILVINKEKKGIPNYIGANTFLEIGFAHVLDKPIFLYNSLPDTNSPYYQELIAMQPIVINKDLTKIKI